MRWLAGNCGDLGSYGFGVVDMPEALDFLDNVFGEIADKGHLLLDEDFMMGIFKPLIAKIPPFQQYLTYMFDERMSCLVGSRQEDD